MLFQYFLIFIFIKVLKLVMGNIIRNSHNKNDTYYSIISSVKYIPGIPLILHHQSSLPILYHHQYYMQSWYNMNYKDNLKMKFYDINDWNEVFLKYHYLFNTDNNDGTSQSLQSLSSFILLNNLKSIEKSDIFRYLITYIHGGIYSDIDVTCLQPIKQWLYHYPSINITTSLDQLDFIFGIEFSRKQVQYKHIGKIWSTRMIVMIVMMIMIMIVKMMMMMMMMMMIITMMMMIMMMMIMMMITTIKMY